MIINDNHLYHLKSYLIDYKARQSGVVHGHSVSVCTLNQIPNNGKAVRGLVSDHKSSGNGWNCNENPH